MPGIDDLAARNHRLELKGGESRPQVFGCSDDSEWVLKLMGNPQGSASMAADWVGSVLATMVGVPVPEPSIVEVSENALRTAPDSVREWAQPGPAFGSRYVVQNDNPLGVAQLSQCKNLNDVGKMVVLDTWLEVLDRQKPDGKWNLLIDQSEEELRLLVIDYGFSLSEALLPRGAVALGGQAQRITCPNALRQYIDWDAAREAARAMLDISRDEAAEVVQAIPAEWGIDGERQHAIIEHLFAHREIVAELVEQEVAGL